MEQIVAVEERELFFLKRELLLIFPFEIKQSESSLI